jgi:transcriptional regulator with XRE-family HTH domain
MKKEILNLDEEDAKIPTDAEGSEAIRRIGELLYAARMAKKLRLKDVSKDLEIPSSALSNLESGVAAPTFTVVRRIGDYLGVDQKVIQDLYIAFKVYRVRKKYEILGNLKKE